MPTQVVQYLGRERTRLSRRGYDHPVCARIENSGDLVDGLIAHRSEDERDSPPGIEPVDVRRQRARPCRIVRAIENSLRTLADPLQPARPDRVRDALSRNAERGQRDRRRSCILHLVLAGKWTMNTHIT